MLAAWLCTRRMFFGLGTGLATCMAAPTSASDDENTLISHAEERREVRYYGPINTKSLFQLNLILENMASSDEPIHLHVQSGGGDLIPALYTADLIARSPTPIYTYVDGFAASAATLLSVSGQRRFMTAHSTMLIHQLSSGHSGNFRELQQHIENDSLLMSQLIEIYVQRCTMNERTLKALLDKDKYLSAQECLDLGLVDQII